jgi:hypothetical protein
MFYFLNRFSQNIQISNFMKIHPVGVVIPCGIRTDGHTNMAKIIDVSQFCDRAEKPLCLKRRSIAWQLFGTL